MADIRIVPGSSIMSFTSSLNFTEKITQDASGSLNLYGSGSTGRTELFSIDGNNGRLFTVSDDLSDSLFSVNTIAGLPVIEAFANNTVVMGQYGTNALVVSGSNVGIGTTTPSEKLEVNGNVKATGFKTLNGTSTQFLMADGSTNSNTYAKTDGTDATGTWGINISGNASKLNPLSGDSNYKLAYTADGARTNAGEWGRAVMYYVPNGQTYGIRVDRADYADNAGTVGGYAASSLWRSDGGTWNPSTNITLNQAANSQEWSFDIYRNGYTGGYWHVWDSANSTMLKVDATSGKVYAPYNFVGNLEGNAATATKLQTARTIGGVSFDGTANIDLPGVNAAGNQNTTGNAATATTLQTARTINGVSFNGSANISISRINDAGGSGNYLSYSSGNELETYNSSGALIDMYLNYSGGANSVLGPSGNIMLHAGNYNNYAPTKTGTGASGTWGINITGNATSANTSSKIVGFTSVTTSNWSNTYNDYDGAVHLLDVYNIATSTTGMNSIYGTILQVSGKYSHDKTQLIFNGENGTIQYRKSWYNNTAWTGLRTILDSSNYSGYSSFSGAVGGDRIYAGWDSGVSGSISCTAWFRSSGANGWYNETYGGGIWMNDTTWVKVYGSKGFWVDSSIRGTDILDSYSQSLLLGSKSISGNTTIDNSYHNKIVRITASCTITIPAGLRTDFNCTFEVIGAYTAQFVDGSGATTSAPFGRYLKTDLTAMFYCTGTASNYRLNGSLATS